MTYCSLFHKTSSFQNRCIAFSGLGHLHEYIYLQRYQYSHLCYFHFCRGNKGLPTYIFTGNIDINGVGFVAKIIFVVSYCFSIALALLSSIEIKDCEDLMGYLMLFYTTVGLFLKVYSSVFCLAKNRSPLFPLGNFSTV